MKVIKFEIQSDEVEQVKLDYKKQLIQMANLPIGAQGGVSVADMRTAIKIVDKLEVATDSIELEDAEHEFLNARVQAWPWRRAHKIYLDFCEAVDKAPSKSDLARIEAEKAKATEALAASGD